LLNPAEDQEPVISKDATQSIYVNEEFDHEDVMPYQGFMQELIGMNIGDEKTTTHTFNEVEKTDDLFEKEVEFAFEVKAISKADVPSLNDEFAQMVNPEFQTLDALKDSIREQIESYRKSQYENGYVTEVFDEIVESSTAHYPPELFHDEGHAYIHQLMEQVSRQGMEWEAYLKANDTTEHQLIEESREDIERRIKRALVLEEVARAEELRVDPDELQSKVAETMMQGGLMNYMQQLPKKQADDISRRITMDSANQILNDKLMQRVVNIASGKQEEIEKNLRGENTITEEDILADFQSTEDESQEEAE
jgi:FKBP-type peptidyl-prolyl cis-trans isomerase (trigger factor)